MNSYIDKNIDELAVKITNMPDTDELKRELDAYLFINYCEKGYLSECEPEYCSYRYTNSCRYIKALREILEKYNINLRG